jgi:AcrR family transcriptional regulator
MSYQADDYSKKQAIKEAAYAREYKAWLATLTPEERYQAKRLGLNAPLLPGDVIGCLDEDAADTPMASVPAAEFSEPSETETTPLHEEQIWDILRRLIGELLAERNARLTLECLALVSGLSFLGDSMAAVARRHGVTRAAVSKRCIELTERLRVIPSRAMALIDSPPLLPGGANQPPSRL